MEACQWHKGFLLKIIPSVNIILGIFLNFENKGNNGDTKIATRFKKWIKIFYSVKNASRNRFGSEKRKNLHPR
jgi:hypothetical protein